MSPTKKNFTSATINENDFPLMPALSADSFALAVIVNVEGPSYRRCGAAMVIHSTGRNWGNLSSGCIDKNVVLNAKAALETGKTLRLQYGRGSPYWDMQLPCGGALEIQIFPHPDTILLTKTAENLKARKLTQLTLQADGQITQSKTAEGLHLTILPQIRILVFGTGLETICFTELALAAGCRVEVFSPDTDVLTRFSFANPLNSNKWPEAIDVDERTAIVTFFHDHDREPQILSAALSSPAFFVGAQGSKRAHAARCASLLEYKCSQNDIEKLTFPLGLIPSTRDPQTLAVSVLAHILNNVKSSPLSDVGTDDNIIARGMSPA